MEETRKELTKQSVGTPAILADVTERIRYYARRSGADLLELGKALTEAKALVPRGEWEAYVKDNAGLEKRSAEYFMQAFRKWGTDNADISVLNAGQIIALLPATEEEIKKISEDGKLSDKTTREIKAAIKRAREDWEEEAAEKNRDAMQCMANDKARALQKQKDAFDKLLSEKLREAEAEKADQISAMKAQLDALQRESDALRFRAAQAEESAEEATRAAIEGSKDVSARSNELEAEKRKLRQELDDKDELIREMQEQYDAMQADLLNAKSTIAKGDAERSTTDILSSESVNDAVRMFIGQVGRIPFMHSAFATMSAEEREEYRANILQIREWAEKSLLAVETVNGNGGVV